MASLPNSKSASPAKASARPPTPASEEQGGGDDDLSWLERRELFVQIAIKHEDVESLRKFSALPGGFGSEDMRRKAWRVLLNTRSYFPEDEQPQAGPSTPPRSATEEEETDSSSAKEDDEEEEEGNEPFRHPDEGQVLLDTRRSFVSYPKGLPKESKAAMQADLQDLIVGVLRKYPKLNYFQGYHDIMSVLYLTFVPPKPPPRSRARATSNARKSRSRSPHTHQVRLSHPPTPSPPSIVEKDPQETDNEKLEETQASESIASMSESELSRHTPDWELLRQCAEVVSLCRVRDAMAKGMEPMMGLLRLLKRLLRAADPQLSKFSATISPVPTLPFFALSWILCLFSHDIDTLEPVQRMFDFLLARNPISAIYLAVAILIAKKPQMYELAAKLGEEAQEDPTLLHPLFARLPPLHPDTPDSPADLSEPSQEVDLVNLDDAPNPYKPIALSELFEIADRLMLEHPWDGDVLRGREIFGEGCTVLTYTEEEKARLGGEWSLLEAMGKLDEEIVKPGVMIDDDDDIEEADLDEIPLPPVRRRRPHWTIRVPRDKKGTILALGVVVLGVGIAVYAGRAGGIHADWVRWWTVVVKSWSGKRKFKETIVAYGKVLKHIAYSLLDLRI
ncbi:rab-GTPase-TBC domain-domain-containing protein [Naematelia encephala]|uniref:Rab-GTPase-TBC domain-domain-containing protein n=1 Tax=Naematelia encephala TaxID=71784 RepID=A0A1Y2AUV5_9TREE|nr:rab-GTPase-TBC domain-domain-containing protein [Naematelia encephala]